MESADALRVRHREWRGQLHAVELARAASRLCDNLVQLPEYRASQHIAAYWAVNGEIGLDPLIDHALANGKCIYLPILDALSLRFAPYHRAQPMRINRFKLPEPDVSDAAMWQPQALHLVLVPLTVFDLACHRLGMGGGYYDRSFAFRRSDESSAPILIGVAHARQCVDQLHPEPWDVRLDAVATDQRIYRA